MIVRSQPLITIRSRGLEKVCAQCRRTLLRSSPQISPSRAFTIARHSRAHVAESGITAQPRLRAGYFLDNGTLSSSIGKLVRKDSTSTAVNPATEAPTSTSIREDLTTKPTSQAIQELPHRRRQRARKEAAAGVAAGNGPSSSENAMPPDAPSKLTTLSSQLPTNSLRRKLAILLSLSKPRLSFMIVLTTTSAYTLYPVPALLSPTTTDTPSLSALTLLFLTAGTGLTCASANALNMLYEPKWDALMTRTRNRPLVRGLISNRGALIFAIVTGLAGTAALYYGVNPTVSFLGAFNIFLYAGVYTPMKRISVLNTWVGALVGGIPPLMGWAAAAGQSATGAGDWRELLLGEQNIGGWLLAALLIAWQFPHFMALSWPIREEYKAAGYRMLAWTNPARNARVALRYSLVFLPICIGLCAVGITEWTFAAASAPLNGWMVYQATKFWRYEGLKGSARGLFWASIWHMPGVLVLAMVEKKGMWQRVWRAVSGQPEYTVDDEDEEEWEDVDDDEDVDANVGVGTNEKDGGRPRPAPASALSH